MSDFISKISQLSIVIPAYNEAKQVGSLFAALEDFFKVSQPLEIIIVDDGSSDETAKIVRERIANSNLNFFLETYQPNCGKGQAVRHGLQKARGDYILFFDADLSTSLDEINNFLLLADEYDLLIGSRRISGAKVQEDQFFLRKLAGWLFSKVIDFIIIKDIPDTQCGFKMYNQKTAQLVSSKQTVTGWSFDIEHLLVAKDNNLKIKQIPVVWKNDRESKVILIKDFFLVAFEIIKIKLNQRQGKYR